MSGALNIVEFPGHDLSDIPARLRSIADAIESGAHGTVHNLAYIMDCGDANFAVGLLGAAPEPGATGYLLFGIAKRQLEDGALAG